MYTQETSRSPWKSQGGMDAGEAAQTWESIHHASSRAWVSLHSEKHCFRGNLKESWGAELTGWIPSPLPFQSHILCGSLWGRQEKLCSCSWSNFVTLQGESKLWLGQTCVFPAIYSMPLFLRLFFDIFIYLWWYYHPTLTHIFSSVQFSCSVVSDSATPWTAARQASLSIIDSWSPPKLMSIESVMPTHHLTISSSAVPFSSCL